MTFHVGQKVVFVDDTPPKERSPHASGAWRSISDDGIRCGEAYEVRAVGKEIDVLGRPALCLWLVGIVRNDPLWKQFDLGTWAWRFRPLVEEKTDISIFTALLNPQRRELVSSVIGEDINTL